LTMLMAVVPGPHPKPMTVADSPNLVHGYSFIKELTVMP
jgi:hypothetical protein